MFKLVQVVVKHIIFLMLADQANLANFKPGVGNGVT